jgi:hypothetical protein
MMGWDLRSQTGAKTTAPGNSSVNTQHLVNAAVTSAKIGNDAIIPSLLDAPEWMQIDVTSGISLTEDTESIVTAAANAASLNVAGSYGTLLGWDDTNKRPYAIEAGTVLVVIQSELVVVHSAASDIQTMNILKKNTSTVVEQTDTSYVGGGTGTTRQMNLMRMLTVNANDYLRWAVRANQATGLATTRTLSNGSQSASSMQIMYLGAQ